MRRRGETRGVKGFGRRSGRARPRRFRGSLVCCLTAGTFPISIVDDENANEMSYGLVASAARARSRQITEGARAIAKKLGEAESCGYTSAFQGIVPTQANAESLIRNIMSNPSRVFHGRTIDVYNAAGQGVRFEAGSSLFKGLLEGARATR